MVLSLIVGLYRTFIKKDKNWHNLSEGERYDLERTTKSGVELMEEDENSKKLIVQMKIGLNTYIGETNKKGDPHGKGKLIRPTDKPGYKTVLSCNFKNGLAHGEGTKQFINKEECYQTYIGEWKDGDEYGKGVYFDSEKYVEGEWKDGKFIELKITKNK